MHRYGATFTFVWKSRWGPPDECGSSTFQRSLPAAWCRAGSVTNASRCCRQWRRWDAVTDVQTETTLLPLEVYGLPLLWRTIQKQTHTQMSPSPTTHRPLLYYLISPRYNVSPPASHLKVFFKSLYFITLSFPCDDRGPIDHYYPRRFASQQLAATPFRWLPLLLPHWLFSHYSCSMVTRANYV